MNNGIDGWLARLPSTRPSPPSTTSLYGHRLAPRYSPPCAILPLNLDLGRTCPGPPTPWLDATLSARLARDRALSLRLALVADLGLRQLALLAAADQVIATVA
jgi:hypothetical protein